MKKTIVTLGFILLSFYLISNYIEKNVEIPDSAIRIRILANSNTDYDQEIKNEVKENIQKYMYGLLKDSKNISEAESIINNNLNKIDSKVGATLHSLDYNLPYNVNFGLNYFPKKIYKGIEYDEGYYESLLITLGDGIGDNWWCVLFPPLCLVDEDMEDQEYKLYIKEVLEKFK